MSRKSFAGIALVVIATAAGAGCAHSVDGQGSAAPKLTDAAPGSTVVIVKEPAQVPMYDRVQPVMPSTDEAWSSVYRCVDSMNAVLTDVLRGVKTRAEGIASMSTPAGAGQFAYTYDTYLNAEIATSEFTTYCMDKYGVT